MKAAGFYLLASDCWDEILNELSTIPNDICNKYEAKRLLEELEYCREGVDGIRELLSQFPDDVWDSGKSEEDYHLQLMYLVGKINDNSLEHHLSDDSYPKTELAKHRPLVEEMRAAFNDCRDYAKNFTTILVQAYLEYRHPGILGKIRDHLKVKWYIRYDPDAKPSPRITFYKSIDGHSWAELISVRSHPCCQNFTLISNTLYGESGCPVQFLNKDFSALSEMGPLEYRSMLLLIQGAGNYREKVRDILTKRLEKQFKSDWEGRMLETRILDPEAIAIEPLYQIIFDRPAEVEFDMRFKLIKYFIERIRANQWNEIEPRVRLLVKYNTLRRVLKEQAERDGNVFDFFTLQFPDNYRGPRSFPSEDDLKKIEMKLTTRAKSIDNDLWKILMGMGRTFQDAIQEIKADTSVAHGDEATLTAGSKAAIIATLKYLDGGMREEDMMKAQDFKNEMETKLALMHFADALLSILPRDFVANYLGSRSGITIRPFLQSLVALRNERPDACPITDKELDELVLQLAIFQAAAYFVDTEKKLIHDLIIEKMQPGDRRLLPSNIEEHVMAYEIHLLKDSQDSEEKVYELTFINSGGGIHTHDREGDEMRYRYYRKQRMNSKELKAVGYFFNRDITSFQLNDFFFSKGEMVNIGNTSLGLESYSGQKSGTCSVKSISNLIKWFFSRPKGQKEHDPHANQKYNWFKAWHLARNLEQLKIVLQTRGMAITFTDYEKLEFDQHGHSNWNIHPDCKLPEPELCKCKFTPISGLYWPVVRHAVLRRLATAKTLGKEVKEQIKVMLDDVVARSGDEPLEKCYNCVRDKE